LNIHYYNRLAIFNWGKQVCLPQLRFWLII
jgi:hypothetical protein